MFAKVAAAVAVSAALLLASSAARADEPAPDTKPLTESRWYGWQTLATDAAAVATIAVSLSADSSAVATAGTGIGVATYTAAPVAIHAVHGHAGKAIGDAALRIVTPILGAGIGAAIGLAMWEPTPEGSLVAPLIAPVTMAAAMYEGAAIGGLIGAGTAIAIDAAALTHEDVPAPKLRDERPPQAKATVRPTAGPTRDGFVAGIGGTF